MRENVITMVVVVACAMAFVSPIQAQKKTEMGVKGGFGFANLTGDVTDMKSMLSFGGGGLFRFSPSPQFSIQPEVLLVLKGAQQDNPGGDEEKLKLTYIEVPVLFMYQPPTKGTVRPAFFTGPAISLLLSAKIDDEDFKDNVKSADIGFVFGAGVDFESGAKGKISLDGRYTLGLTNINDVDPDDYTVKNGVFSFGVSYIFPLGQ